MKWLKRSSILLFALLLFVGLSGTLWGETTSEKLDQISTELTEISKQYNELSVKSQLTLMDLQEILPELQKRVNGLQTELGLLKVDSQKLMEQSGTLLQKWTILNDGISNVSSSIETLGISLSILDDSVKRAEKRSNTGLWISIGAFIAGAIALGFSLFGGK